MPETIQNLDDKIPIPPKEVMNIGLSAAKESTMLSKFGKPGELTRDCSGVSENFKKRIKNSFDVGPFRVNGLDYAVESLQQIFAQVKNEFPEVYNQVKKDGLLCVRHRRMNKQKYSNHSWGTAIDLYFGKEVIDQGINLTHRGNFLLYPFFNKYGWYWGAEFSGDYVDSMHFELAEETILKLS